MEKNLQFIDSYHEKNYIEVVQNFMGKLNKDLYIEEVIETTNY